MTTSIFKRKTGNIVWEMIEGSIRNTFTASNLPELPSKPNKINLTTSPLVPTTPETVITNQSKASYTPTIIKFSEHLPSKRSNSLSRSADMYPKPLTLTVARTESSRRCLKYKQKNDEYSL